MNLFARNPWGWSTFAFWVIWLWFVLNCDRSYLNSFSDETCTGIADGLFFALPWLFTLALILPAGAVMPLFGKGTTSVVSLRNNSYPTVKFLTTQRKSIGNIGYSNIKE